MLETPAALWHHRLPKMGPIIANPYGKIASSANHWPWDCQSWAAIEVKTFFHDSLSQVCFFFPLHCMGLSQWCPTQATGLPISGLQWSAHGATGTCFPSEQFIVDMVFLGDTRSAEELAVFTNMAFCALGVGSGWKRISLPSFQVNVHHCLLLR